MAVITNVEDLRRIARRTLPRTLFDFVDGGAYDEQTLRRNEHDFDALLLRQRVMVDTVDKKLHRHLFGATHGLPIGISPIGMGGMYYPDGEIEGLRAAQKWQLPFALSTLSICSMESLRAACDYPFWFQLYVMRDRDFTASLIERAEKAQCPVLLLTVDLPVSGKRHRDIKNGLSVPLKFSAGQMLDVAQRYRWWGRQLRARHRTFGNLAELSSAQDMRMMGLAQWCASQYDPSLTWEDVSWVRRLWKGKLVAKGIITAHDARQAIDHGCDGIIVSNHGGRQLDGARSTISSLRAVSAAVAGQVPIILDGGIRSGQDVIRALALGADFCMMGRPYMYALAHDGQRGVNTLFSLIKAELEVCMALMGISDLSDVDSACIENPDHFQFTYPPCHS